MVVVSRTFYIIALLKMSEGDQVLRLSHSVSWHLCLGNIENFSRGGTESLGPVCKDHNHNDCVFSEPGPSLCPCKAESCPVGTWPPGLLRCPL